MSEHLLEPTSHEVQQPAHGRRHHRSEDQLFLTELDPEEVLDHIDDQAPVDLSTFGTVRETCPKCAHTHLQLVLRQGPVRTAHLFCVKCQGCFDAHYANGASALTI